MKYDEKNIKELFKNEENIWDKEDLDWLNSQLVYKLQNNELPEDEKSIIIKMIANDQAVMNRYLELKQHTAPLKESMIDKIFMAFKTPKMIPLLATGLALMISLVVIFKQTNEELNFDTDIIRGVPQISVYPTENSIIKNAPEYFIANKKDSQAIRLQLKFDNTVVWLSELQQSNKFYMPRKINQKLLPGHYKWAILDKHDNVITMNNFTIQ